MQSSRLILISSVAALLLCALPYGCAGKAAESSSGNTAGAAGAPVTPVDGTATRGDGAHVPVDGSPTRVDGSQCGRCGADGSLPPASDGEGDTPLDGSTTRVDGASPSDGAANEGTLEPDGAIDNWSDGSP